MRTAGLLTRFLPILVAAALLPSGATAGLAAHPGGPPSAPAAARTSSVPTSAEVAIAPAYVPSAGVRALGPLPASTPLSVDVGLASRDPAGLAAYANATAVAGTAAYRAFLTPTVAAATFGAAPASIAAAETYFAGYGLSVAHNPDGLLLSVSGPSSDVAAAFGTAFEQYEGPAGRIFVGHATPAVLPSVAPWTGAFGLGNVTPIAPDLSPAAPSEPVDPTASCSRLLDGLAPCQVATAYDAVGLTVNGTPVDGQGYRVAVVDAYASAEGQDQLTSDFDQFANATGLSSANVSFAYPVPTTEDLNATGVNSGWGLEDALDLEWARASAPGASVEMVYSPNAGAGLYYAIDWIVATGQANVFSMSWGEPEVGVFNPRSMPCSSQCNASTDGSIDLLGPVLELATVEGITAVAASGDCGSSDGTAGVAVNFPASDPFVLGVGATNLYVAANGTYEAESGWSGNESGASADGCENGGGSGGGYSIFPHPWWQSGTGTVPAKGRGVPDVAMVGGGLSPVAIFFEGAQAGVYGTSVGSPIWAGLVALADQYAGQPLGLLTPSLYRALSGPGYSAEFHDIQNGTNGYSAGVGWDPVTGIGSPVVGSLLPALARGPSTATTLSSLVYASPRFGRAPLTVDFEATVHGGTGAYPLEGIAFGDGNASALLAGAATHTYAAAGVYSVQAYAVDSSGNITASPPIVVVVGGGGPLTVSLNASLTNPAVGAPVDFTATASGGVAPYTFNFSFGDGTYDDGLANGTVEHAYAVEGGFCAEVVVQDNASAPDGGASARVAVAVGGAASPACGNPTHPLQLIGNASAGVRDAPADYPSLFSASGGSPAPAGLGAELGLASNDPYVAACGCTILRSAGTWTVRAWENDTVNGEAHAEVNVTVAPALSATFTASTLSGPAPLAVTFGATASGGYLANASATRWTLPNGTTLTGASVHATFATAGEYVVVASLSDSGYGNASEAFVLDAEAAGGPSVGVTATVSPAVDLGSGTTVSWRATPIGPAGTLASAVVAWDLGNGGSAYGPIANETYFAPIDLLAADTLAASVQLLGPGAVPLLRVPITLAGFFATEAGGFVPAVDALSLGDDVYPTAGETPLAVNGSATASGPGPLPVTWEFGDGTSGNGTSVTHVYYGPGEYTVRIGTFDTFGDRAQRLVGIAANEVLALSGCGPKELSGSAPLVVRLAPTASGGAGPPYSYRWSLPNGSTSTATNVTLTLGSPGTYGVSVEVSDPVNATIGCAWTITVAGAPLIPFAEVLAIGAAAGAGLAAVFLWATRPRSGAAR